MKVKDMDILQHNLGKSKQKSFLTYPEKLKFDPRPTTEREIPYVNLENSHSCLEVLPPYQRPPHSIFPLVYPSVRTSHLLLKIQPRKLIVAVTVLTIYLLQSFNLMISQIHELEKATRNQSNSQIWGLQKKGWVTASRFHKVDKKMQVICRNRLKPVKYRVNLYY